MDDLALCSQCGARPVLVSGVIEGFYVECEPCSRQGPFANSTWDAVARWNKEQFRDKQRAYEEAHVRETLLTEPCPHHIPDAGGFCVVCEGRETVLTPLGDEVLALIRRENEDRERDRELREYH